jgi:hypothetical protein
MQALPSAYRTLREVEMKANRRKPSVTEILVWTFALVEAAAIGLVVWHH